MPDLQNLLDEIDRLELEIYPGPWVANDRGIGYEITTQQQMPINSGIKDTFPRSDAEFIALARDALPTLAKALRAVMELHKPRMKFPTKDGNHDYECLGCRTDVTWTMHPCPTLMTITNAMNGADDD